MGTRQLIDRAARAARWRARIPRRVTVLLLAALTAVPATAVGASILTTAPPGPSQPVPEGVHDVAAVGLGRSVPVRVVIPRIDVDAEIVPVGLDGDGLAVPPDASRAGWYERGTSPGELGSAVLVGKAATERSRGPAVFARLDRLAAGDRIRVVREDRAIASFTVDRVEDRVEEVGAACRPNGGWCRAARAPQETGAEAQLRLVSRDLVVWATLAP